MSGEWSECSHYYVDFSGGFGWPSCIHCGQPPPVDNTPVRHYRNDRRRCCETTMAEDHVPTCQSMDARVKRGQPPIRQV